MEITRVVSIVHGKGLEEWLAALCDVCVPNNRLELEIGDLGGCSSFMLIEFMYLRFEYC